MAVLIGNKAVMGKLNNCIGVVQMASLSSTAKSELCKKRRIKIVEKNTNRN